MVVAAPLAAAAAVVFWLVQTPELPPVSIAAYQGSYTTPTDELLQLVGFDLIDTVPSIGCPGSFLGCLDLDALGGRDSSKLNIEIEIETEIGIDSRRWSA